MADTRYNILFAGELAGGADPVEVRRQLQKKFKLSNEATERLFNGNTIAVRRDVDLTTAERYQDIFHAAGARARIRKVESSPEPVPVPPTASTETPEEEDQTWRSDPSVDPSALGAESHVQVGERPEEQDAFRFANIDISHLSLVEGSDWTLEDCQPPLRHIELPDISYLELVEVEPEDDEEFES